MSKATILIVEDEAIVAADLAGILGRLDYEISGTTAHGEEAVELAKKLNPDLVLMDIHLAGAMNGVEAANIIHREYDLPVIFLTAHSDHATLEKAKLAEPAGYLLKPFEELGLKTHIEMALFKHRSEQKLRLAHDELELHVHERTKELKQAQEMLKKANESLEMRVAERTAELEAANRLLRDSRRAALNMMEDADAARQRAEETSVELRHETRERKRAENQLRTINDELERKVEQRTLELQETQNQVLHAEKLSAIGKLSASIAHEFNNPLQGILSIIKGVKKRAILEDEDRELLDAAIGEGDRVKNLIRSLQDFNRPSSGRKVLMDVHQCLDSILLLHKSDFKGRRISVELDYAELLPQIFAVPDQIKQVFLNLLANAADACHVPGGKITILTWHEDEQVAVAIKDTGIGIEPENMEQIFRPFYTTKPEVKGTGLGLSITYGIVKNHQGDIQVDSQPGEGTTFTILLPIKSPENAVPAAER